MEMEINSAEEEVTKQILSQFGIIMQHNSNRPMRQNRIICSTDPSLRAVHPATYWPKLVIIGPLNFMDSRDMEHSENVVKIEIQKRIYLASFLWRPYRHLSSTCLTFSVDIACRFIKNSADRIHGCYEQTICRSWDFPTSFKQREQVSHGSSDPFIEMILVDVSFIIELFLRAYKKEWREETDFIFDGAGKIQTIRRDLYLAENQLPFFILKGTYEEVFADTPNLPSFLHLTCHFFSPNYNKNTSLLDTTSPGNNRNEYYINSEYGAKLEEAKHFTDLLRTLQLPYSKDSSEEKTLCSKLPHIKWIKTKGMYFLDRISSSLLPSSKKTEESLEANERQGEYLYSAVLLREAGVKFKVNPNKCLLDIEFDQKKGELKIPPLRLDESTESFFGNLMAWEQCYYPDETQICDYIFLMEYLVKSAEDVDLLVRKRILINQLGSHKAVVTLFNNLSKDITPTEKNHYSDIFGKLNAYNAVRHHGWIAILRLQYFSTLWRGVATIAAIILLVLTLVQTICALISL